jgi:hypothetical protein
MNRLYSCLVGIVIVMGFSIPQAADAKHIVIPGQTAPQHTLDEVCIRLETNLGLGTKDTEADHSVAVLQNMLFVSGMFKVQPTGFFGPMTLEAVKNFQKANSVPPTGFVGPITRAKIALLTCNPTSSQAEMSGQGTAPSGQSTTTKQSITILSPSVGGLWKFGETKEINWQIMSQSILPADWIKRTTVDLQLLPHTNCKKDPCPLMLIKPYDIALKISADKPFIWAVGDAVDTRIIPQGVYDISVCLNGIPRECATSDVQITIE